MNSYKKSQNSVKIFILPSFDEKIETPPNKTPNPINMRTNGNIMWPYLFSLFPTILLLTIK